MVRQYRKDYSIHHKCFHQGKLYSILNKGNIFSFLHFLSRKIHYFHNLHDKIQVYHVLMSDYKRSEDLVYKHHIDYLHLFQVHDIFCSSHDKISNATLFYHSQVFDPSTLIYYILLPNILGCPHLYKSFHLQRSDNNHFHNHIFCS